MRSLISSYENPDDRELVLKSIAVKSNYKTLFGTSDSSLKSSCLT